MHRMDSKKRRDSCLARELGSTCLAFKSPRCPTEHCQVWRGPARGTLLAWLCSGLRVRECLPLLAGLVINDKGKAQEKWPQVCQAGEGNSACSRGREALQVPQAGKAGWKEMAVTPAGAGLSLAVLGVTADRLWDLPGCRRFNLGRPRAGQAPDPLYRLWASRGHF